MDYFVLRNHTLKKIKEGSQLEQKKKSVFWNKNLLIVFGVTLMAVLGVSSISPIFPVLIEEFGISESQVGLLITFFTLPGVILTPIFGILADRYGRKKILIPSLLLFGIAGFLCGFSKNFSILLFLRFFQGMGAASLGALNVTIIGDLFYGEDRVKAMGYNASVLNIGTAVYPSIGGALSLLGWNFPFFLPVLAIPIGLLALFLLEDKSVRNNESIKDYFFNLIRSVRNAKIILLFIGGLSTFIILYGVHLSYFPFLASHNFGLSPFLAGLLMSGMSFTTALASSQLGRLGNKFNVRNLLIFSYLFYTLSLILTPFMQKAWQLLIPIIIFGMGHGINVPSIQTMIAELAPSEYRGALMSLNGMILRLGQTLGPLIMGLLYAFGGVNIVYFSGAIFAIGIFFLLLLLFNVHKT